MTPQCSWARVALLFAMAVAGPRESCPSLTAGLDVLRRLPEFGWSVLVVFCLAFQSPHPAQYLWNIYFIIFHSFLDWCDYCTLLFQSGTDSDMSHMAIQEATGSWHCLNLIMFRFSTSCSCNGFSKFHCPILVFSSWVPAVEQWCGIVAGGVPMGTCLVRTSSIMAGQLFWHENALNNAILNGMFTFLGGAGTPTCFTIRFGFLRSIFRGLVDSGWGPQVSPQFPVVGPHSFCYV